MQADCQGRSILPTARHPLRLDEFPDEWHGFLPLPEDPLGDPVRAASRTASSGSADRGRGGSRTVRLLDPPARCQGCSPSFSVVPRELESPASRGSGSLRSMTHPLGGSMALSPLWDQRVPGHFSRGPNVRHPASDLDAPLAVPVVSHPLHVPAKIPHAGGHLPVPAAERLRPAHHVRDPAGLDVRPDFPEPTLPGRCGRPRRTGTGP